MKKIIKEYGHSRIVTFTREDCRIYDLEVGDIIDIEIVKVKGEGNESI